jgi:hypothetical protein
MISPLSSLSPSPVSVLRVRHVTGGGGDKKPNIIYIAAEKVSRPLNPSPFLYLVPKHNKLLSRTTNSLSLPLVF